MRTKKKKHSTVGLTSGKIHWGSYINQCIYIWARRGFHARLIAEHTGLTVPQVYSRCRYLGISLRDYRNGRTPDAVVFIKHFSVEHATPRTKQQVRHDFEAYEEHRKCRKSL